MHACSLKSTSHMSFRLESLNLLPGLQRSDGILMDPMWNDYDNLLVKFLSYLQEVV